MKTPLPEAHPSDTHRLPLGRIREILAAHHAIVPCPRCPTQADDENDEVCGKCGGLGVITVEDDEE